MFDGIYNMEDTKRMITNRSKKFILKELANLNRLVLLDLDDTVVEANDIFIYRNFPGEDF